MSLMTYEEIMAPGKGVLLPGKSTAPIIYRTDSHRPSPAEFADTLLQVAKIRHEDAVFYAALASACENAQVFDFGRLDDKVIGKESERGAVFYNSRHMRLPFKSVMYWYTVKHDLQIQHPNITEEERALINPFGRYATLAIDAEQYCDRNILGDHVNNMIVGCDFLELSPDEIARVPFQGPQTRKAFMLYVAGFFRAVDARTWYGRLIEPEVCASDTGALSALADGIMGLTMMLNTRGIPLTPEEPSPKLNAKRLKNGKRPLVRVTHVNTAYYYEALKNTSRGGHHASPVPHLRRGHIRHYQNGNEVWIRDALVNCKSIEEITARDHYEVQATQ